MRIAVEDAGEDLIAHIRIGEFGISPLDMARYIQSGGPLFAINSSNGEGGGAVAIYSWRIQLLRDGTVIGAVGVIGGARERDDLIV